MTAFAIIGFGEVGGHFARDLLSGGATRVAAYDVAPAAQERAAATAGVISCRDAAEAASEADVVIVSVTAGSALDAARSLAGGLAHAPFVLDVNSVSPATKQQAARAVESAGGRYVEAAVMTSVPPHGLRSPMLLGGRPAADFIALMAPFGMRLTAASDEIGKASSIKMCRSVMIKGLEALLTESMLAARHYGVEQDVLRSLADTLPHPNWTELARYSISRALLHGRRRAEEMREVAQTVADAGIEPLASTAIATRQDWAAVQGRALGPASEERDLGTLLDSIRASLGEDTRR